MKKSFMTKSSPIGPQEPTPSNQPKKYGVDSLTGFKAKPMTFLGMHFNAEQAGMLWQVIVQTVNQELEREKKRLVEAMQKLRGNDEE